MIPVTKQPEPESFDIAVRQPGNAAIREHKGNRTRKAFWDNYAYWSECLDDLHALYNETCAYLGVRIARQAMLGIQGASVEHFVPVSIDHTLAYEWSNYRLVCGMTNSERGNTVPFLDPFELPLDTFRLLLNSGKVVTSAKTQKLDSKAVANALKVINNKTFATYRASLFARYKEQPDALREESPFIYQEAVRQGQLKP